CCTLPRGVW
nr:immunoglobulin heavy chain junction region [Mus musculus]